MKYFYRKEGRSGEKESNVENEKELFSQLKVVPVKFNKADSLKTSFAQPNGP